MRMVDLDLLNGKIAAMQACEPHYAFHFLNDAQNPSTEWECIEDMIENMPVIEAQPVKRGKWIPHKVPSPIQSVYSCSKCNSSIPGNIFVVGCDFEFCPYCGANLK